MKQHRNLEALIQELKMGDKLKIRAVKVILKNGTLDVSLTSLLSQNEYKTEIFEELYFQPRERYRSHTNSNQSRFLCYNLDQ